MTTRSYGILAGVVGTALGAWWWTRHRAAGAMTPRERGTVIFDNTPTATGLSDEGVI